MDAKTIIKNAMTTTGFTLTKVVQELNRIGVETTLQNLSNKLSRDTIRFYEVEQILNVMGLTINTQYIGLDNEIRQCLHMCLNPQEMNTVMSVVSDNRVPYHLKMQLRNFLVHSNNNDREIVSQFINTANQHINQTLNNTPHQ